MAFVICGFTQTYLQYRFQYTDAIPIKIRTYFVVEINRLVQVNSKMYMEIQGAKNSQENTEKEKLMKRIKVGRFALLSIKMYYIG